MEAAAQSTTPAPAAAAKLGIDKFADGGIVCLKLAGTIDESFEGKKLAASVKGKTLILDLGEIKKISSFGIREWVDFINTVGKQVEGIVLIECAPKVVDQLNMVANFAGTGRVFSFYTPYRCDYCDTDSRVLLQVDRDWDVIKSMKPPERPCGQCGEPQYFDEDPSTFFSFIAGQERFELDGDIASFLATKLNYAVSDAARKLKADKVIEGRSTYLKLQGDLDGSFPREKLAEGLEGIVILDVGGVGKIEPAGAAEWRGFLQMMTPLAEAVYLLGVPPPFLEKLTRPEDLGPKAQVVTFAIPYTCNTCATTTSQLIDVEQHYDVLKFATPPETKCPDCKNAMVCAASEGLLSHLPILPRPSISPETRKFIKEVRERKPEKKKVATTVAEAAAQGRQGGALMMFGAAALTAALVVGGFFGYRAFTAAKAHSGAGLGKVIAKSGDARPAWITASAPFSAYCNDAADGGLSCVGVSSPALALEDGQDEAREAALDGIADAIAHRIAEPQWKGVLPAIWTESRQAKIAAYEKWAKDPGDARYDRSRREIREARRAVAALLTRTAGGAVPPTASNEYWEQYEGGGGGPRYLAFAEYAIPASAAKSMVDGYATTTSVLGATATPVFPLVAWRYPDVDSGVVIISLGAGEPKKAGLSTQYVVLEVGGRKIKDAVGFAQYLGDDVARLKKDGGALELVVKAGDSESRKFTMQIPADKVPEVPGTRPSGSSGRPSGTTNPAGTGNVNVWDRYDRNTGAGRDDPTQ